jgi:hypothetical protein
MKRERDNILIVELAGRCIVLGMAVLAFLFRWWAPLLTVPIAWLIWNAAFLKQEKPFRFSINTSVSRIILQKRMANGTTWLFSIAYLAYSVLAFGLCIGHWTGWIAGIVVGLTVSQFLGLLRPYRIYQEEQMKTARERARSDRAADTPSSEA